MDYNAYFEPEYNVPKKLKNTAIAIMRRFTITGICDGMYICNRIAKICGIGDGCGHFIGDEISNIPEVAKSLQSAYGCNIFKEDLDELEYMLKNNCLDKTRAVAGLKKFISVCKKEKETCDSWRVSYLNNCINTATRNLKFI